MKPNHDREVIVGALLLFLLSMGLFVGMFRVADADEAALDLSLKPVIQGLSAPGHLTHAGDSSGRVFVTELGGVVYILQNGQLLETPFLDLRNQVANDWEQGLLSVAFHPDYRSNGRFFIYYVSNEDGAGVLSEFRVSAADPNRADPSTERVMLRVPNELKGHYGGQLQFGPEGYLYLGIGDGMIFGAARRQSQDLSIFPGKLLRLDVSDDSVPYTVPADNPFVGKDGARPEIWAYGFRNPWRFSFDESGRLFVGDVGHERFEEVNIVTRGGNYGWPFFEADACLVEGFRAGVGCRLAALRYQFKGPITTYDHLSLDPDGGGNAITGGFVYRGEALPELHGS